MYRVLWSLFSMGCLGLRDLFRLQRPLCITELCNISYLSSSLLGTPLTSAVKEATHHGWLRSNTRRYCACIPAYARANFGYKERQHHFSSDVCSRVRFNKRSCWQQHACPGQWQRWSFSERVDEAAVRASLRPVAWRPRPSLRKPDSL